MDIASALCEESAERACKFINPPWVACDDAVAIEAWKNVQELKRQRFQLIEIFPHKRSELEKQFDDQVMQVAAAVYEAYFELTP